ncbi:synaptotagmin-like protein 2 isoform X8 [Sphaerodactylus townsendi]|uniref:synaptotagmin-like protein 2 isoform X8 n=1 Tax=Sphaerodactylus townsendi TaxID=933632 RepID=UPI0020273C48|nr:synaptotagmin-like protein 2 isoform X8 [Sphaerodactylus townsendi]
MIDLSFLTDEEQEAILKVLQRDANLKRAEEERVRHLPEKVDDEIQIKNMSGQWFYEVKSKRHRDKIHGADIIRASMRRKPLTAAELSQNKTGKKQKSWVNNVNKEVLTPPELFGAIEEAEGESKSSLSPTAFNADATPQEGTKKAAVSPSKERKNPFNNSNLLEENADRKGGISSSSETSKKDSLLPSVEYQPEVNIANGRLEKPELASVEPNDPNGQTGKPPIPRARKNIHKTSDVSVTSEDSFSKAPRRIQPGNGQGTPPRGILKRNSSTSSTDSEVLRLNQTGDPSYKNGLPASTILEGVVDKNSYPGRDPEGFSQNSLERAKQVRFSSSVSRKERPPSLDLHEGKESGEFGLLDSDCGKTGGDRARGSDSLQDEQTPPIKPLASTSMDLNGRTEDQATSREGNADLVSYNADGSGILQSQESSPAEFGASSDSPRETFPKVTKEPSRDEAKLEIKTGQRSPGPDAKPSSADEGKVNTRKEDLMLSAEDVSAAPSFPVNQFSNPEKVKRMSKSVPTFLQEESDGRETDTASENSYSLGKIKKSPSSLTNLSGSSGLASLSSVSTSVVSVYSGDFGNVDVKGNIQFAIDYVEQLKELHIFIAQCKDLAVADVKKQRSDPYVKCYLLPEKYKLGKRKTSVKKKTLNPVYNEILRYKVDKILLTSQRLNISVWHNDTFGRNSFLGEVDLDLGSWDWDDRQIKQMIWYPLKPRAPLASLELENRGEIKLSLQYIPQPDGGKKPSATGEVHIWVKECHDLPLLKGNKLNTFVKCTVLPDTSRKSRQKTRAVAKATNPVFNHTMVYDGFKFEDLKEACVELTVWDHKQLVNHFLGGLRIGLGTGKSYGTAVDWMDSTLEETSLWERMMNSPDQWVEGTLPLRMLTIAKMTK